MPGMVLMTAKLCLVEKVKVKMMVTVKVMVAGKVTVKVRVTVRVTLTAPDGDGYGKMAADGEGEAAIACNAGDDGCCVWDGTGELQGGSRNRIHRSQLVVSLCLIIGSLQPMATLICSIAASTADLAAGWLLPDVGSSAKMYSVSPFLCKQKTK